MRTAKSPDNAPVFGKLAEADSGPTPPRYGTALVLAAGTALVFMPAVWCGFVNWDDGEYVNNPSVLRGLSLSSIRDAFCTVFYTDWAPLTRLSYLADASVFGPQPWGFHLTNVLLHAAATGILFGGLSAMTRCPGRSFVATLLFAIHPLRVESVAWVSERKDVLSVLFLALGLVAYDWYCRRPSPGRYFCVFAAMLGSLMSKATLVTFPVLLALLDFWPLRRMPGAAGDLETTPYRPISWRWLVAEKIPMFALSLGFSILTVVTQGNAVHDEAAMPLVSTRLPNALYAPVRYLGMTIWPVGLHARYTHPGRDAIPEHWWILGAAGCIALACIVAACRRRLPAVSVGLLWYGVAILPVSGLVKQFGLHSHADRYTYVPHIGLFVAVAYGVWFLVERTPARRWIVPVLAGVVLCSIAIDQILIRSWRDSATLWSRVLEHEPRSDLAGEALVQHHAAAGDIERALAIAAEIVDRHPDSSAFIAITDIQSGAGDLAGAAETCRREVIAKRRQHGPRAAATLEAEVRHMTSLRNAGAPDAERIAAELEPELRRTLGLEHAATLRTLVVIAGVANRSGDAAKAERYAREVLDTLARTNEPVPEIRKPATIALAESLDRQGRTAEAGEVLTSTIAALDGLDGAAAVRNSQLAVALAAHLARTGHVAEARDFLGPIATRIESLVGPSHPAARTVAQFFARLAALAAEPASP